MPPMALAEAQVVILLKTIILAKIQKLSLYPINDTVETGLF